MRCVVWIALVGWVGLLACSGAALAQTSRASGKISGKIVDADDKPAMGLALTLVLSEPAVAPQTAGPRLPGIYPARPRVLAEQPVAETNTNEKGEFTFSDVPAGAYLIKGGSKERGFIYLDVKLKAGESYDAGTIKLIKIAEPAPPLNPG